MISDFILCKVCLSNLAKNGKNSNSKTVLESVLVTDSKNGFRFKLFSQEVAFSEYQK